MKTRLPILISHLAASFSAQCSVLSAQLKGTHIIAANESTEPDIFAVNEAAYGVTEEGVMIVPFAEVPVMVSVNGRKVRGLQRIDAQAGNDMSADMSGIWGALKNAFIGRPIFLGHPFHPDPTEAIKYPDKRARGFIKSVEVANEGIRLIPKYNKLGNEEVTDQQMIFHSPQWRMKPVMAANGVQEVKGGMLVFRPCSLHSGGLTNNPNMPVPALMGANEDVATDILGLDELITALITAGFIKAGDDRATVLSAVSSLASTLQWARDAKAREEKEMLMMREKVTAEGANEMPREAILQSLLSQLEATAANESKLSTEHSTLSTRFESARAAHVDAVLLPLITANKVSGANKDTIRAELISAANEADIATRIAELANTKPKLGTTGGVTDQVRGQQRVIMAANEASNRSRLRTEAVNECLAEITKGRAARNGDPEAAWNLARSRNPQLFTH